MRHLLDLERGEGAPSLDLEWLRLRCEDTLRYADDLQDASVRELKADFAGFDTRFPSLLSQDLLAELNGLGT
ncbi:hypothetical protein [Paraliomyxa miuraensis]|uniref:hypothetical protein n=1 Tax=Paraliomyxa miuraensis TaxID=376150 RepID=UPI00224CC937|nr:hypothetical protein [Paraliomyxa miuraensis]MCX4247135.1 hypothetical protein [Paraliomyxa miuraensis]